MSLKDKFILKQNMLKSMHGIFFFSGTYATECFEGLLNAWILIFLFKLSLSFHSFSKNFSYNYSV